MIAPEISLSFLDKFQLSQELDVKFVINEAYKMKKIN